MGQSITFDECVKLVACGYCKAPQGKPCDDSRRKDKSVNWPHRTRAHAAFAERKRLRRAESRRLRKER